MATPGAFFTPAKPDYSGLWNWNPVQTFVQTQKDLKTMELADAESKRLATKNALDMRISETMLPLDVELARAKINSTKADLGVKAAQSKYFSNRDVKAATLAQQRLNVSGTIEDTPYYEAAFGDSTEPGVKLNYQESPSPTSESAPGFLNSDLDSDNPLSSFILDEPSYIFESLPNAAKIVSSSSGMNKTAAAVMDANTAATEPIKPGVSFDLESVARDFKIKPSAKISKELEEEVRETRISGTESPDLSALPAEFERPRLSQLVRNFKRGQADAKAFVDTNKNSMDTARWATAQGLEGGARKAYTNFDNDLRQGGYGITAQQVDVLLEKYPANYAAIDEIAPFLQGNGDITEAMARYERASKTRLEGDTARTAKMEKIRDQQISLLAGDESEAKTAAFEKLERSFNALRTPEERFVEFGVINSEAGGYIRNMKTKGAAPTTNYRGEPLETATDKTTDAERFEQLVTQLKIPTLVGKKTEGGIEPMGEEQVALWFRQNGMQMKENTPVNAGMYVGNSLVPVEVSYSRGERGVEFTTRPLVTNKDIAQEGEKKEPPTEKPKTPYDSEATKEKQASELNSALKKKKEYETEIALLNSKATNIPDVTYMAGLAGMGTVPVKMPASAADKQKTAQGLLTKSDDLKKRLAELKEKYPSIFPSIVKTFSQSDAANRDKFNQLFPQ